jgi:hypothetical protein
LTALPLPISSDAPRRFPEVVVDGMLFTLVEPRRDLAVDYNRWYEGDHFYATVVGPGVLSGRRFVCTAPLKRLRIVGPDPVVPDAAVGSFLAIYYLAQTDEFSAWGAVNTGALHRAGRIFTAREHIHTAIYGAEWFWEPASDGISPEIALDHPFDLIVTEFWQPSAPDSTFSAWLHSELVPRLHSRGAPDLVCAFRPRPLLDGAPSDVPRATGIDDAVMVLHFHRSGDAEAVMAATRDTATELEASGRAHLQFASPFIPTVPGTDQYTDELWDDA